MATGSVMPFVNDDEEDGGSLYSVGASDSGKKLGPDGDGAASNKGSSLPEYSSRESGATNPENNAPANSGGKSAGADPLSGSLYEAPPAAPTYQAPDRSRYKTDRGKLQEDESFNPDSVQPSIGQRIRAGIVGAANGALGRDTSGAGKILNQNRDRAKADQDRRIAADKDVLAGDRTDISDSEADADKQRQYYETNLQGYNANREAHSAQWNRDHDLSKDAQAQTNWKAEDQERNDQNTYTRTHGLAEFGEQVRHNKASESNEAARQGFEGRRVSVEEKRLQDEESDTASGLPPRGSASDQRIRAQNEQKYRGMRKDAFDKLNFGDAKASDEYHQKGFQQSLQDLQKSANNPDTDEPWKPGEREAAVAELQRKHVRDLTGAEEDFVENMRGMGYKNIQPIQFNERGEAVTDSSGRPLGGQQSGGPQQQAGPGPAGGAQPAATPPAQAQQQPRAPIKTRSGKTVTVGDTITVGGRPARVTGVNPQTGKVTAVPVGQ